MNSEIAASDEGVIWNGKSYGWENQTKISEEPLKEELTHLNKQLRSTITVSDHYLREIYKKSHK